MKGRLPLRQQHTADKCAYYASKQILYPTQTLTVHPEHFKSYKKAVASFAEKALCFINQQLLTLNHLSLVAGRKIRFELEKNNPFYEEMKDLDHSGYLSYNEVIKEGLEALKQQGYIYSYKLDAYNPSNFYLVC